MFKKILLLSLLFALPLSAKVLSSPFEAMQHTFGNDATISKKNILLSKKQTKAIQESAKVKLESKIFRIFKAVKKESVLGYGVLVNKKVRSKNGVILYLIDTEGVLKGMEIIAFNEPPEYIPSEKWNSQFQNISTEKMLHSPRNIPTITGATLSARAITNGSRIAFAIYNQLLKGK
jgi:Na+-translocating ferredoxin:NAD+ oxidoreductase RnfG subunit